MSSAGELRGFASGTTDLRFYDLRLKPFKTYAPKSPKDRFRIRLFNKKTNKGLSMKNKVLFSVITLLAGSLIAAESTPKDDVLAAAKALGNSASYSWKSTVANADGGGGGGGGGRGGGPSEGKTQKDSYTLVTSTFGGNTSEMVLKGDKGAMSTPDNGWQTLAELEADQGGPGQFMGTMVRNFKAPAALVTDLVTNTAEIKKDGDTDRKSTRLNS